MKSTERARLTKIHGKVWNMDELRDEFQIEGFSAPLVTVMRFKDQAKGTMQFAGSPRLFFGFKELADQQ